MPTYTDRKDKHDLTWRNLEPRHVRVRLCEDKVDTEKREEDEGSILIFKKTPELVSSSKVSLKNEYCSVV